MKMKAATFLFAVTIALGSLAQETSELKGLEGDGFSSKGFRIGISRHALQVKLEVSNDVESVVVNPTAEEGFALSLGYASLPIEKLGWTASYTFTNIELRNLVVPLVRIEGNLAYAFSPFANVKAGLNVSNVEDARPGFGFQTGVGFQITKNLGLDVGYVQMKQSSSGIVQNQLIKVLAKQTGFEIGLNGTF